MIHPFDSICNGSFNRLSEQSKQITVIFGTHLRVLLEDSLVKSANNCSKEPMRLSWRRKFACEIKTPNGTHSHDVAEYVRIYVRAFIVDIHLIYLGVYTCTT